MKKIVFFLGIMVGLVVFGFGCNKTTEQNLTSTTTISELRDDDMWATYEDIQYNFAFSYPRVYEQDDDCRVTYAGESDPNENYTLFIGGSLNITVDDFANQTLDAYLADLFNRGVRTIETKEKIKIAGQDALRVTYRFGGVSRYGEDIFIIRDNKIYTIAFFSNAFNCSAKHPEFPEIDVFKTIYQTFTFNP